MYIFVTNFWTYKGGVLQIYNVIYFNYVTIQLQGVPQKSDILNLDIPGAKLTLNFDLPF